MNLTRDPKECDEDPFYRCIDCGDEADYGLNGEWVCVKCLPRCKTCFAFDKVSEPATHGKHCEVCHKDLLACAQEESGWRDR